MKKMFVCSRPLIESDNTCHRHLLGILYQDDNGKYQFRYTLGNENNNRLLLSIFPDKDKIYGDRDTRLLLDDYLPSENDTIFMKEILNKMGMKEYDEWEWLKAFESTDENAETKLYETLPNDIIIHEDINNRDDLIEENTDEYETETDDDELMADDYDDECLPDGDILTHTEIPDTFDDEIENEFDELSDAFVFDDEIKETNDTVSINDFAEPNTIGDTIPETFTEISKKQEAATIKIITKKITRRVKKSDDPNDFILPPPEDPYETIQQRLENNIKQRQEALNKKLVGTNQTNNI